MMMMEHSVQWKLTSARLLKPPQTRWMCFEVCCIKTALRIDADQHKSVHTYSMHELVFAELISTDAITQWRYGGS